jgi:LuxR family transcriptional regulator, maltose regulon positive regulatory protein
MPDSLSTSIAVPAVRSGSRSLRLVTDDDALLQRVAETAVALAGALLRRGDAVAARDLLDGAGRALASMPEAAALRVALDEAWGQADDLAVGALDEADALTLAELRVLRFLPSYLTLGQIAARLHVSTNTVKTQAHAVYRKLRVSSRSAAVERAAAIGLVDGWPARCAGWADALEYTHGSS